MLKWLLARCLFDNLHNQKLKDWQLKYFLKYFCFYCICYSCENNWTNFTRQTFFFLISLGRIENFHKITSFFHSKYCLLHIQIFLSSLLWMIINYFTLTRSSFFFLIHNLKWNYCEGNVESTAVATWERLFDLLTHLFEISFSSLFLCVYIFLFK